MKTRLYAVNVVVGQEQRQHLVDASSPHTAKRQVGKQYISASIASGQDVAKLMAKGVKPESATDDADSTNPLPLQQTS